MKVRIKGDPSIYRFVAYYIVEADTPDAVFGPTLRLKKDLTVKADGYRHHHGYVLPGRRLRRPVGRPAAQVPAGYPQ